MTVPERLVALEARLESMEQKIDKLIHAVEGNGKAGLLIRVDRVEQRWKVVSWVLGIVVGTVLVGLVQARM